MTDTFPIIDTWSTLQGINRRKINREEEKTFLKNVHIYSTVVRDTRHIEDAGNRLNNAFKDATGISCKPSMQRTNLMELFNEAKRTGN